jgi:ABC-2 type transport system ATP-binding protein
MPYALCMDYTLEAEGLVKAFGATSVLDGLDLGVREGTIFALLGRNGAGKTTTVRILATLLRPDAGTARVAGFDVVREPRRVRGAMSLTGQYAAVDEPLTGEENLLMMARLRHLGRTAAKARTRELLEQFDLVEAAGRRVATYSGGMRRRLDLAVTLVARPRVVVLDEPTTGLDPRSRRAVWAAVRELAAGGTTILLTTQYLEEADQLADRIAVLHGGRVVAEGSAAELKARAGREAVELFFAGDRALDAALRALADPHAQADRERLSVRVATDGSAGDVRRVLDVLGGDGVVAERLELHRPTLDDVFLTLTEAA